uniref:Uncharacterized protein n=1 Tax=Solanum tuberosum TaxID=4113 RepID=M1DH59_SOLTU
MHSAIRPLIYFIAFHQLPSASLCPGAQHTGTKGEDVIYWRFTEWVWRFADLHFFVLLASFAPFYSMVSTLSLKFQILET